MGLSFSPRTLIYKAVASVMGVINHTHSGRITTDADRRGVFIPVSLRRAETVPGKAPAQASKDRQTDKNKIASLLSFSINT